MRDAILAGVSINVIYEVYEGYPVIRKWVEIRNNSVNWLRLSELVIDDMEPLGERLCERLGCGAGSGCCRFCGATAVSPGNSLAS